MKTITTLILFGMCLLSHAQQKITFNYDSAGNQYLRELCISGCNPTAKKVQETKEIEALTEEDLLKFSNEDVLSYYPNPVKEELYLKWQLIDNTHVKSIQIYSVNGQLVKTYQPTVNNESQNIPFQDYPSGVYAVILYYSNGNQESIKIIKQ